MRHYFLISMKEAQIQTQISSTSNCSGQYKDKMGSIKKKELKSVWSAMGKTRLK